MLAVPGRPAQGSFSRHLAAKMLKVTLSILVASCREKVPGAPSEDGGVTAMRGPKKALNKAGFLDRIALVNPIWELVFSAPAMEGIFQGWKS